MRRITIAAVLVVACTGPFAHADPPIDDRRARDGFMTWNQDLRWGGYNAFQVTLYGPASTAPDGHHTAFVTDLEITTRSLQPDGSVLERTFAAPVIAEGENPSTGAGGFTYTPTLFARDPAIYFELPSDFGGAPTTMDIRLFLPQAEGDCLLTPYGPCGGSVVGYHNDGTLFLGISPTSFTDASDAIPQVLFLD